MCNRAGVREGHFLSTRYGIWSTGLGVDVALDLAMMCLTSSSVNSLVSMAIVGEGGSGIHEGRLNVFAVAEYVLVKKDSASCLLKDG